MATTDLICSPLEAQPRCLSAVQHVRTMRGGTQAHLMKASDGRLYVVKFQNNPFHSRVLAGEFLATRLGLWLGLSMPPVEVIEVPEWLVNRSLLRIEDEENRLTRCASGRQLAFRYVAHAIDVLPKKSFPQLTNRHDFIRVLPFDKWVGNCDNRQAVFVKQQNDHYFPLFIDQHQCFDADRWTFPDLPHHGTYRPKQVYREVTGWHWFEPILSRIEKVSRFDLWKLATEIPPEWYNHHAEALSRLIERLYRRRFLVRHLITEFRQSRHKPFPNWPT